MKTIFLLAVAALAGGGGGAAKPSAAAKQAEYYGTLEPFAADSIYFVVTDRFVDGDPTNDHRDQGGAHRTFDIPLTGPNGDTDNIGYLGGDFKGVLDHARYIRDMGFTSVWITPIVDNPDEAFTGGDPVKWGSFLTDQGKAAYHGYWGDNFYVVDEHLPSKGLDFKRFTDGMHRQGLKVVLDIVCNHGSPAFGMNPKQPKYGQVFAKDGTLLADHGNLKPEQLDPAHNPLQRFFKPELELAQLSNFDENNPAVFEYLSGAYLQWIDQGADAFRVDTIKYMPPDFWRRFAERMRAKRPGFFMFGEAFDYEADKIAPFTQDPSGNYSVLDFPLKGAISKAFGKEHAGFEAIEPALYLEGGPYKNPYDLVTFYDNHDMARLDATDEGFIDAHNFLFTARGIPAIYYGSESGFERGRAEHQGNRNYFGVEGIAAAQKSPIHERLARIAKLRAATPALQRGIQLDLELQGDRASFYRVYQQADRHQIALVLLNKGDGPAEFAVSDYLEAGKWRNALGGEPKQVGEGGTLRATVGAHDVAVYVLDAKVTRADFAARLATRTAPTPRTTGG